MLLGLSAISIPIIIHLLNRRRIERVVWAAMRFLRVSVEQNQRRLKIEDMLLLVLRCLLIALLALALARPVLRAASAFFGSAKSTAVIVLDNSYSMSQTDGVQSRFDAARQAAAEVIGSMSPGSSVAVFLASDRVFPLIPEPTFDLTLAKRQIEQARLFDRTSNLYPSLKAAMDTLSGRPAARKEIYLITDGQSAAFRQINDIRNLLDQNKSDIRAHWLIVGQPEPRNLGITSLRLDSGLAPVNVPVRLDVRVKNYGKLDIRDVNVSISVDNDPSMDQAVIPSIPAGEQRSASLFARIKSEGYHSVTARIDPDHLPADDTRSVALRAVKDVRVLLIDGDTGREARESEVFYLKAALRPVPRAEWEDYFVKLTTRTPTELEAVRFEDFDAIIAANVTDFAPMALSQLANYVRTGGALWIFPGDNINSAFYNDQLYHRYGLLPATLGLAKGDARNQENYFTLQDKAYDHEIVNIWRDPAAGSLAAARFFRAFTLVPPDGAKPAADSRNDGTRAQSRVILRFADNAPAMVERDVGLGRVILFASSADTAWNDLGARAGVFVPLVHRTLGYLLARQDEHLTIPVGQEFAHIAPIEFTGRDALITKSPRPYARTEGDELRESRRIEMQNGAPLLQFSQTDLAGPYEIRIGDSAPIRFAAQADPDESSLDVITDQQADLLSSNSRVTRWQPGTSLKEELRQARLGTELWLPLAMLALILATMETLLAHWFSKPK